MPPPFVAFWLALRSGAAFWFPRLQARTSRVFANREHRQDSSDACLKARGMEQSADQLLHSPRRDAAARTDTPRSA